MTRLLAVAVLLTGALPVLALTLAAGGRAAVATVFPDKPDAAEREAAEELAKYLGKMTGAAFEQVAEKDVQARPAIFLGATQAAAQAGISAAEMDRDGFIIKAAGGNLYLVGHDATATELGVHFFLQRYAGIRWYIPLEIGEHVPSRPTFSVPDTLDDRQEPDWRSRLWSSAARMDPMWEKRNLCRPRYEFHHNLLNVLKPSEVYDQHPEWYPLIDGKRISKPPDGTEGWQPCFANKEMAAWVGQKIVAYFDEHPTATSYSLGINDVGASGYCQCAGCQALDDRTKPTFRDRPNYSNRVFTFMNRVAGITSQKYPDKLLGCLSYANCEEVPSFPVHPNIIPYLTNDRAQWRDARFKRVDQDLLRRWARAARQLGVYDYYYGAGYVIPRFFPALSGESIKFCYGVGVRAWYAEIYSNWGLDGCKAWLASQLLWDVKQDPRKLVDEYYTSFFGAAREPMKRYWDRCEQIWMRQGGRRLLAQGFLRDQATGHVPAGDLRRTAGLSRSGGEACGHRPPSPTGETVLGRFPLHGALRGRVLGRQAHEAGPGEQPEGGRRRAAGAGELRSGRAEPAAAFRRGNQRRRAAQALHPVCRLGTLQLRGGATAGDHAPG